MYFCLLLQQSVKYVTSVKFQFHVCDIDFTDLLLLRDEPKLRRLPNVKMPEAMKNAFHVKLHFLFFGFWGLLGSSLHILFLSYKAIVIRLIKTKVA